MGPRRTRRLAALGADYTTLGSQPGQTAALPCHPACATTSVWGRTKK